MTDDARYPEFRPGRGAFALPGFAGVGLAAGMAQLARAGAPPLVLIGVPVLVAGLIGGVYLLVRRTATLTGPEGLTMRTGLGERSLAWRDVQAIQAEGNPAATIDARAPRAFVVAYDRSGGRVVLPNVEPASVPDLVRLWEGHRGDGWAPSAAAATSQARARRTADRVSAWMVAVVAFMATFMLLALVIVAVVLTGGDLPASPGVLMFAPALVVAAVAFVTSLRRRQRTPAARA